MPVRPQHDRNPSAVHRLSAHPHTLHLAERSGVDCEAMKLPRALRPDWRPQRLLVKAAIILLGSAAVYFIAATRVSGPTVFDDDSLIDSLEEQYGPKVSQGPEEWLILDFFQGRRNAV